MLEFGTHMGTVSGPPPIVETDKDKSHRGMASQFFVAGELCRRGVVAVLTLVVEIGIPESS